MNKPKPTLVRTRPRYPRVPGEWRIWPFALGALSVLTLACSDPAPIQRVVEQAPDAAVDSGTDPDSSTDPRVPSWCSARAVLELRCQRCHGSPPAHGAPFALVEYADTQVLDHKGNPRFEVIALAIEQATMPAQYIKLDPPVESLQAAERATLLSWCANGGLLTSTDVCDPSP